MLILDLYEKASNYLFKVIKNNYYVHIKKLYNLTNDQEIISLPKISIIKPEHFILLQYYFVYLVTNSNKFFVTFFVNGLYINDLLTQKVINNFSPLSETKNQIITQLNTNNENKKQHKLLSYSYTLLYYLIFLKLFFSSMLNIYKILWFTTLSSLSLLNSINITYKKRFENSANDDYSRLLIITSNKEIMKKIIQYTNLYDYGLFIIFLNIFLLFI